MSTLLSAIRSLIFVLVLIVTVIPWAMGVLLLSIFRRGDPVYWACAGWLKVAIWSEIEFEASKLHCPIPLKDLTILDAKVTLLEHETIIKGYIDVPLLDAIGIKHLTPIIIKLPHDGDGFIIDIFNPDSFLGLPVLDGHFVRIDKWGHHLLSGLFD